MNFCQSLMETAYLQLNRKIPCGLAEDSLFGHKSQSNQKSFVEATKNFKNVSVKTFQSIP